MLLQALHFLLAYWCIRFVFFKKAVTVIEMQERERDVASGQLRYLQDEVHSAESLMATEWYALQRSLVQQKPENVVLYQSHISTVHTASDVVYDQLPIEDLAHDVEASLVKKITQAGDL